MAKRLRKAVAVAAVSLLCLPLGACGGISAGDNPDAVEGVYPEGSAVVGLGNAAENPAANYEIVEAPSDAPAVQPVADTDIPEEPAKSPDYDGAYLWDGDLVAAGWGDTDGNKTEAPIGYVLVDNEDAKTISIQNATAFAYFAHEARLVENDGFKDYTVNLDCDIDLGGDNNIWIPASFTSRKHATDETDGKTVMFKGVFDGNGHTIYNFSAKKFYDGIRYDGTNASIYVSDSLSVPFTVDKGEYVYGLFATAGNAAFKNLNIVDVNFGLEDKEVDGMTFVADSVGAVVGYMAGDCTVQSITVGSDGSEQSKGNGNDVIINSGIGGGIVGRIYANKLNGKPYGVSAASGGIISAGVRLGEVIAKDCTNYADIGSELDAAQKGGIIGYAIYRKVYEFDNCVNYGNITGLYAGGMTSYYQIHAYRYYADAPTEQIDYVFTFENCVNHGDITVVPEGVGQAGGMIGAAIDYVTATDETYTKTIGFYDCYNYGTVTANRSSRVGGIVGELEMSASAATDNYKLEFNRAFNYGDIVGYNGDDASANASAGGVFGTILTNCKLDNHKACITIAVGNCGAVTGKVSGGIVGAGAALFDKCTIKYLIDAYKQN